MKENEALKDIAESGINLRAGDYVDVEALKVAANALEEIQRYREIGTVAQCRYAVEKQNKKEPIRIDPCKTFSYFKCPSCNRFLNINKEFCVECGQHIDWSEL